jgi:hypothetical protein
MQLSNAGMLTDCVVVSWEFANVKPLGKMGDAYGADPAGQSLMEMATGPNSPITRSVAASTSRSRSSLTAVLRSVRTAP